MKLTGGRRVITEDFKREEQGFISKLAFVINPIFEQIIQAFNKNITVSENLAMDYKTVDVIVDGSGNVTNNAVFTSDLTKVTGILPIRLQNGDTTAITSPTGGIFCTFNKNGRLLTITHTTGLTAGTKYRITLLVLGP